MQMERKWNFGAETESRRERKKKLAALFLLSEYCSVFFSLAASLWRPESLQPTAELSHNFSKQLKDFDSKERARERRNKADCGCVITSRKALKDRVRVFWWVQELEEEPFSTRSNFL